MMKDRFKLWMVLVLWGFCCMGAAAQDQYFKAVSQPPLERDDSGLGGMGGMLVFSPHDDLIVSVEPIDCHAQVTRPRKGGEGMYCYEVRADLAKRSDARFIFSRQGKALQTELKQPLRKNHWHACRVEEVANPIDYKDQTGRNTFSGEEDLMLIEFSSTIQGLTIKPSSKLKCTVDAHPQESDASVTITSVRIDSKKLREAKEAAANAEKELAELDKQLQELSKAGNEKAVDELGDRIDQQEEKKDQLEGAYREMCQIEVSAPGSNVMYIDISEIGYKERRAFLVMALTESYESLLAHAKKFMAEYASHTESSYYDAARTAYDKVLEHADCPIDKREEIRCERDTMASIRKYTYFVEETERRAQKAEAEQGFGSDEVFKNLSGEYKFIERLIAYHPEMEGLTEMKTRVWNRLSKHPKSQETVYETVTVQRQVITGKVTMKNQFDTRPLNSLHVNVSMQSDVGKKEARLNAKMVGNVAADGTFSITMPDDYHYIFIDGEKKAHHITPEMTTIQIEL